MSKLRYIVNHVFLPPKLPQQDDSGVVKDTALIEKCLEALTSFQAQVPVKEHPEWEPCIRMLRNMLRLRDADGGLLAEEVESALGQMADGDVLALHIRGQNAGLIIRRLLDQYSFESFEVSPTAEAVTETKGRLKRCFPGPAVAISQDRIADSSFRGPLTSFLVRLDIETPKEASPTTKKAKSSVIETRDTVHPGLITELLTGILFAVGQPLNIPRIHKNTRDEVLWKDTLNPWRRSSLWLLLRVALQTSLIRHGDTNDSPVRYKSFLMFFMAYILQDALQASLSSCLLFCMMAKISRRAVKLDSADQPSWLRYIQTTVNAVQQELSRRWNAIENSEGTLGTQRDLDLSQLCFLQDTRLTLSTLKPYLMKVMAQTGLSSSLCSFKPNCSLRIRQNSLSLPVLTLLDDADKDKSRLIVTDLELWVPDCLDDWLKKNLDSQATCTALANLISDYAAIATSIHSHDPEGISLMLLTLMELWTALDKCTVHHYPLLQDYDHEFPEQLFEPLLLPKKPQMDRLLRVEEYVAARRSSAKPRCPSIFCSTGDTMSFAVRYFEQSPQHQELRREIELKAESERSEKELELEEKYHQYQSLMQESAEIDCESEDRWIGYRLVPRHSSSCYKCALQRWARGLKIDAHEWPLPEKESEAKSAVFELDVPIAISKWRDTTYSVLVDVFSVRHPSWHGSRGKIYSLHSYTNLNRFAKSQAGRLQLASVLKPFSVSHYGSELKVSNASKETVCLKNGLRYAVYDSAMDQWAADLLNRCDVREKCTFKLPPGPYETLQYAVDSTIHTSNEVIAGQAKCPEALSLHEFYAFASLRSGHRLQWRAIARELAAGALNFNREETHALILQAAWQAGPLGQLLLCRDSHADLEEEDFGMSMLSVLDDALSAVEGNWQGATAARTFTALATRLLSFTSTQTVRERCFRYLRRAREITLRWARELNRRLQAGEKEEELKGLNARTLEMALSCYGTFDVDLEHIPSLLKSDEDVAVVTECSIIVHDRCPAKVDGLPVSMRALWCRHWRLAHRLEPVLRRHILAHRNGLDITVRRLWQEYQPGVSWTCLEAPNERWLKTETSGKGSLCPVIVHLNLLDGSLLINGSPLTRLPRSYESHPTYHRLFGEKVLDVVPSAMEGMVYATRNELFGYQVHFGMHCSELIIRTRKDECVHELLPLHALQNDFPDAFIRGYAHWMDTETGFVELRPMADAWKLSLENWQMRSEGQNWVLVRGTSKLVDIRSCTAISISKVLGPLEQRPHIHITLDLDTEALRVHLPRFKLDFFLKKGAQRLESKQFRGMIVDANQLFGTLTGLCNKLVLRGIKCPERSVIIPHGDVTFRPDGHHVHVQINTSSENHIPHHLYRIDDLLGRLVDNGSLKSKLFKYYLHAVTAHCLTDSLTGRTGTEEALYGLMSASAQSFHVLGPTETGILELIAQLTPRRQCYPRHLRVMQEVDWLELSPLSQHNSFCGAVASIFKQARTFQMFQDTPAELPDAVVDASQGLVQRASIRDSAYRVHGFGAEDHTTEHDMAYPARDNPPDGSRRLQTYLTAKLVDCWTTDLKICGQLLHEVESWGNRIHGPRSEDAILLGYDAKWLDPHADHLPNDWCGLQSALSHSLMERDKYRVMIFLSTLTYSRNVKRELVETLLAFATVPELRTLRPPGHPFFELQHGYSPERKRLASMAESKARPYHECPEINLPQLIYETEESADDRRRNAYERTMKIRVEAFVDFLIEQWPRVDISGPTDTDYSTYISVRTAMTEAKAWFHKWRCNSEFRDYIQQAQNVLNGLTPKEPTLRQYQFSKPLERYSPNRTYIRFSDITERAAPCPPEVYRENLDCWIDQQSTGLANYSSLLSLVTRLSLEHPAGYERQYTNDLLKSYNSMPVDTVFKLKGSRITLKSTLEDHFTKCKSYVGCFYNAICRCLEAEQSIARQIACKARMWPRLSPTSLLRHLAGTERANLVHHWKECLVHYGLAISALQRAERLISCGENDAELLGELGNAGHQGWNPMEYPDWLLLEIENNLLIRPVQAQIALEMITPSSGKNSVMQLNMGEGKSSVIVPIVAATLADGKKLSRVVVLRPLSNQMFHLLVQKLGGMLNRRIFYMPISRSLQLDVHQASQIRNLFEECMRTGGILLAQPEHLLSFQLMGPERLLSSQSEVGRSIIQTQCWLEENSRDILDESDEILSVRFELIYTIGTQRTIELNPDRWTVIQHILGLVGRFSAVVLEEFPHGLEVRHGSAGSFPHIRILQPPAGDKLLEMVAHEVCNMGLPGVPVWSFPQHVRDLLFRFLVNPDMDKATADPLHRTVFSTAPMEKILLLVKGLIAGGILDFALRRKRWRVNYGLHLSRTMLAVPYHAKDCPAARAEFSHPDTTIVLTCLSYYYLGLSDQQLYTSFETLLLCDQAQEEYECWIRNTPELPVAFRSLRGINLSDHTQCSQALFPALRFSKGAIDFYMSEIVFPKEMKEFPHKLSSSGWDIARDKAHPTTGFSGTNDSRYILPLSISQCDLPQLLSTNATVLTHILRSENKFECVKQGDNGEKLDAKSLLQTVVGSEPPVRVILDVGAQVLELENEEVARVWLSQSSSQVQAAVFFDKHNELVVMSRDWVTEPLMVSPFAKQMDQCLIYLDEAHTRGTDLKLPTDYRAAVTLGPGLTKDRLVQACMRMRKLGKGQSVMFCGPAEVERKILQSSGKARGDIIDVFDVLKWSILETCTHTRRCIPLWATQGLRYQRCHSAWSRLSNGKNKEISNHLAEPLLEPEAKSIVERYGIGERRLEEKILLQDSDDKSLMTRSEQLNAIRAKCREFGLSSFGDATLQEEQERELSPESEREQQVERPPAMKPHEHTIHPDVRNFILHGTLNRSSDAFQPAFKSLRNTSAAKSLERDAWPEDLLVTSDFARTVKAPKNQLLDSFLRPVQWIASCRNGTSVDYVTLSPYEAQEFLPFIRLNKAVTLHVYSPRVSASMRTFEDLSFCAIPEVPQPPLVPSTIMQLNLFAGQLYLRNFEDYHSLCRFLGLCSSPPDGSVRVACDGFVDPTGRRVVDPAMARECPFTKSPVDFLRAVIALRRKGQGFAKSHFGEILNGELITREKFQGEKLAG
ncbi:hypothetical protein GP486_000421 [Trichoglossum hirsutum]|uniref:ubiquitinyl hydrolase 1 n=1 Tax=Trichoglossum hirsutum TaxID=265104 RepID=A0A9P8LIS2_9PEZI|nr:hypothetical protein GP486_000421 [Trichoglossum hirsutum]